MTHRKWIMLMLAMTLVLSACQTGASSGGGDKKEITVSGAFAIYPLMVRWAEEYQKINPDVRIDVSAGGAGKGMSDALGGMVDIGMVSREVKEEELKQGAFEVGVAKDAVFPTANANNPVIEDLMATGLTKSLVTKIWIDASVKTWGEVVGKPEVTETLNVYTRSDSCGAAEVWSKFCGSGKQEDLQGIGVNSDPGIADTVKKDALGIGYNNLNYAFDPATGKPIAGIVVVPVDINENGKVDETELLDSKEKAVQAVASGAYPEPPARLLHLVTKGKPSGTVNAFLTWILTDGQKYLDEVGYIPEPAERVKAQLEKLQ